LGYASAPQEIATRLIQRFKKVDFWREMPVIQWALRKEAGLLPKSKSARTPQFVGIRFQ
jgi:hypothetical protein